MHMLYNSDHFVVVEFDLGAQRPSESGTTGAYEIVDKFARRGIFLKGQVAEQFKHGVHALVEKGPSEEELDEFISGYAQLAQQPVVLH
jgi:hypothetical protein